MRKIDQAALTRHFKILLVRGLASVVPKSINQREVLVELTQEAARINLLLVNPP